MPKIVCVSGPCGAGKSTFSRLLSRRMAEEGRKTVYLIHGDDFHAGFVDPEEREPFSNRSEAYDRTSWEEILRFNWECILFAAGQALKRQLDVVIDYVIEDELPRVKALAEAKGAGLYYIVLTAEPAELEARIIRRGDTALLQRALFLKRKLDALPENKGRLLDNTHSAPEESVRSLELEKYLVR